MKKTFTQKEYEDYMILVSCSISEIEAKYKHLEKYKKISKLTFDEWVKWQNGDLKIG